MNDNCTIISTTKRKPQSLRFVQFKDAILGKTYDLSVVFIGTRRARTLNRTWRDKDYATDILSFPLSRDSGEIFICEEIAKRKAKDFDRSPDNYLEFLFIHGCVHLLGFDHGKKMDEIEVSFHKKFSV